MCPKRGYYHHVAASNFAHSFGADVHPGGKPATKYKVPPVATGGCAMSPLQLEPIPDPAPTSVRAPSPAPCSGSRATQPPPLPCGNPKTLAVAGAVAAVVTVAVAVAVAAAVAGGKSPSAPATTSARAPGPAPSSSSCGTPPPCPRTPRRIRSLRLHGRVRQWTAHCPVPRSLRRADREESASPSYGNMDGEG